MSLERASEVPEKIRRDQNTLVILGNGVIVFGLWTFAKTLLSWFLNPAYFSQQTDQTISVLVFNIMVVIVLVMDLLLRLFVGLSARNAGLGKRTNIVYVGAAVILLLLNVLSTGGIMYQFTAAGERTFDSIITLIISITSMIILLDLIVASVKVKIRSRHAD